MNEIFEFRKKLVESYKCFSTSFASPRAADISEKVREAYAAGRFWPDPLIQINPNYRSFEAEPSEEVKAQCEDKGYEWRVM